MTAELTVLALAVLLAGVQLLLYAVPANLEVGSDYLAGPRDKAMPRPLSTRTARLQRAFDNHIENLVLFAAAALAVAVAGKSTGFTAACAWAYLAARVVYVPLYWAGVPYLRSAVWAVGWVATMAMAAAALL